MPRRRNPDFIRPWKLTLPATLAGKLEHVLTDDLTGRPIYGARVKLVTALLEDWLAEQAGRSVDQRPRVPSLEELKVM